jgi:PTH1 family peptidyl-tRNA hydrolase
MNLSGQSTALVAGYYKIPIKNIIVIYDDKDLAFGSFRIRDMGSSGGHNGIKSIIANMGDKNFCRVKIGVGEKPPHYDLADYVLGHFDKLEQACMQTTMVDVNKVVQLVIQGKIDQAMNVYNQKKVKESIEE